MTTPKKTGKKTSQNRLLTRSGFSPLAKVTKKKQYFFTDFYKENPHLFNYKLFSSFFITTDRNIGKGTFFEKYVLDQYEKHGEGFVWMRRAEKEVDKYIKGMRSYWYVRGYEVKDYVMTKIGDPKKEVVGYFIALKTSHNFASGKFDTIFNFVFDEYISRSGYMKSEYRVFVDFLKTTERMDVLKIFMLGNKITKNNPYWVKWGLWDDECITFNFKDRMLSINAPSSYWTLPVDKNSSANIWARKDEELNAYMNKGQFAYDKTILVLPKHKLKADITRSYDFSLGSKHYTFYKIEEDGGYYIDECENEPINSMNLTNMDTLDNGSFLAPSDVNDFIEPWSVALRAKKLFFSTFDNMEDILNFIVKMEGNKIK